MTTKEFKHQTIHCDCGDWLKLEYRPFNKNEDNVQLSFDELPTLVCLSCNNEFLPDFSKIIIRQIIEEAHKRGAIANKGTRKKENSDRRYNLCKNVPFKYDANDCKYIPGLEGPLSEEGFFTPVFFNRKVLHKFMNFDEYRVDIAGNTYGTVHGDSWYISFGINRNGKLFVWLGDLDEIPEKEQQYFLSENIESDHDVASEFYAATREAEFAELSNESKLLKERLAFEELCKTKFNFKVFDYEKNEYEILGELIRPVNWNEKGVIHIINCLAKICVESIDNNALRAEIKKMDEHFDMKEMKGMKILEKWIELCSKKALNAKEIMKPFFVLYDFRIILDHKMRGQDVKETIESCYNRLRIKEKRDYESLYDAVIKQMTYSYIILATKLA